MKLLDHPTLTWRYYAEPDPGTAGRAIIYPRGRVLGGSSSINGLIYVRGQPEDFDHWAQLGNRGWSWDDVLPYFKKAENWEGGESDVAARAARSLPRRWTGRRCAKRSSRPAARSASNTARTSTTFRAGAGDSIGWCQQTRGGRRRASAARTYLRPAMKRPNLQVITKAQVRRILFDGKRATGVEFARNGASNRPRRRAR